MKKILFLMAILCLSASMASAQQMLEKDGFVLKWETSGDKLIVTLKAETTGWIAFGIDAESIMKGANIIILWVDDKTGIAMAEDHFGSGRFAHKSDMKLGGSQDFQVLSGTQTETNTEITFSIPLDSGDEYDKPLVRGQSYRLLLASNNSDNISWKHNNKYAQEIEIR
jgi:hypothetical protein